MSGERPSLGDAVERGYQALRTGALLVDFSHRSRGLFHGPKAAEVLNGLVSNEVAALGSGEGTYAVALTPKGKILADLRLLRRDADVLVDVAAAAGAGWWSMVKKYVNPRLARYEDVSASTGALGVIGPASTALLERLGGLELAALPPYGHRTTTIAGATVTIARIPDANAPGYVLYTPAASHDGVADAVRDAGAVPGDLAAFEVARVEAGRPEWGVDMDDNTLVQEALMDDLAAISYTKGCYTGQETVARVHFRGHVNRLLRGVSLPLDATISRGTPLRKDDGTIVGDIRSVAVSPREGQIGLAMVRREIEAGTTLVAQPDGSEGVPVTVVALPFRREGDAA